MGLLGITALRPGRNGMDMSAPNAVNYDEAKAEPRPIVSDVLAGAATADAWWHERRPAPAGTFEKEMYGQNRRASGRERVCQYVSISVVAVALTKNTVHQTTI